MFKSFQFENIRGNEIPFYLSFFKNRMASFILPADKSTPVVLHPSSVKGNKLPPSPHPISKIFIPFLIFCILIYMGCNISCLLWKVPQNTIFCFLSFLHDIYIKFVFRFYRVYATVNLICCLVQKETGKVQFIHAPCYRYASIYGNNDRYHHEKHSGGIKE